MILVTGASGFIGSRLLAALADGPDELRAMVRSAEGADRLRTKLADAGADPDRVEVATAEMSDTVALRDAADGADLVYHLAGGYRGSRSELREVHVQGTDNLLGAIDSGSRLVYVSSTSVYGWDQAWPADESSPPNPTSAYGRAKLAAERLVERRTDGTSVIARPTITYGPGDESGMLARAVAMMRKGVRWFPGDGRNRVHLTHIDDLVAGLVLLGGSGTGTYVIAGPEAIPIRRIFELVATGAALPRPYFGIPTRLVRPVASLAESAWAIAGAAGSAPMTAHGLDVVTRDRAYTSTRANLELGWSPSIGAEEGIPPTAAWLAARLGSPPRDLPTKPVVPGLRRRDEGEAGTGESTAELGFDWRGYLDDPDEGLGTVYERFALDDVLTEVLARTGSTSILHAPLFGMMGWPGVDTVMAARRGVRVGLLDFDAERLDAVVAKWRSLGLEPETHLVDGPDPATWPQSLSAEYDLAFSFAALWWFQDVDGFLGAHARWGRRGVLCCVPNRNVFLRMRASLWHRDLFEDLNPEALDRSRLEAVATRHGLHTTATGLFDIPPFPDTSVPLAKLVRSFTGRSAKADPDEQAWAWSILPYLSGEDPSMADRIARLARWERFLPGPVAPALAHHRYLLFEPSAAPAVGVPDRDADAGPRVGLVPQTT